VNLPFFTEIPPAHARAQVHVRIAKAIGELGRKTRKTARARLSTTEVGEVKHIPAKKIAGLNAEGEAHQSRGLTAGGDVITFEFRKSHARSQRDVAFGFRYRA